jgi:hypothetical protein
VQLFANLSTKALTELQRNETGQAWGQKTLRAIKLANMRQCKPKEGDFKELQGVSP